MDDYQRRSATSTDASLRRVHSDMQQLSGSLLDIIMSVHRLEDKLDRLSSGDSEWRGSSPQRSTSTVNGRSPNGAHQPGSPPAIRRSRSRGDASESSGEGLNKAKAAVAVNRTVHQTKPAKAGGQPASESVKQRNATLGNCRQVPRGDPGELYTRAARAPVKESHDSEPPKTLDVVRNTDMPLEVCLPVHTHAVIEHDASIKPPDSPKGMQSLQDTKFGDINRKLELIAAAVGVKAGNQEGDDEEDRKRLKEKLKVAIELDRRNRVRTIVSSREVWLEYIFGICRPDKRMGKRGSRYFTFI